MTAERRPVLVAPDSFKGTMAADDVAEAIGRGLRSAGWPTDLAPIADGGEGTAAVLRRALGGELRSAAVHDPLGRIREAEFALLADGRTAVVEVAAASGLSLVAAAARDAEAASSAGTGELILAAVAAGARRVLVGAGGSATSDGGAGAIAVIDAGGGQTAVFLWIPRNSDGSPRGETRLLSILSKPSGSPRVNGNGDTIGGLQLGQNFSTFFDDINGNAVYSTDQGGIRAWKLTYNESYSGCAGYIAYSPYSSGYYGNAYTSPTVIDDCFLYTVMTPLDRPTQAP